ncbi:MAG: helix-turn-helix transcriptional regulator [Fibrobacteres bacterium]|nr:helix-turn-helix transcriptional regulator [Fibrobacterota bacterium]
MANAVMHELPSIGKNVHVLRKKVNLSLDALASLSGVSKAMLSQIEQGKVNPTIATLWKIAKGLSVDFNALLGSHEQEKLFYIQRNETAIVIKGAEKTYSLKILTPPQMVEELEQYWVTFDPHGAMVSEGHFAGTEEIVTVLDGSVDVTTGDKTATLGKGDSIRYHADCAHSIREKSGVKSEIHLTVYFRDKK